MPDDDIALAAFLEHRFEVPIDRVRACPGAEGYFVTDGGLAFSNIRGYWRHLHPRYNHDGRYFRIAIFAPGGGRVRTSCIHTLVLEAFAGPRPPGCEARHLNGTPTDNRFANLAWGTPKQNADDRGRHGRDRRGASHPSSRLNDVAVRVIRWLSEHGISQARIAREYGVAQTTVNRICRRLYWTHI